MNILTKIKSGLKLFSLKSISIRKQLPVLICVLLLSIIVLFGSIAYIGMKRTALVVGRERLQNLTGELTSIFQQSMQALTTATQTTGNQPEIVQFLVSRNKDSSVKALNAMKKLQVDTLTSLVDLQDTQGKSILYTGKEIIRQKTGLNASSEISAVKPLQSVVGNIYTVRDSMYFPVIATISRNNQPIGYIVRWRFLLATPKAIAQFSQLLGTNATIYFGNSDGNFWTDMMKPIAKPPVDIKDIRKVIRYNEKGNNQVIASAVSIPGTKLIMLIGLSEQTILESANRFLYWIIAIGAVLLTAGIIAAWLISRNITRPIDQLMRATTAVASGDYSSPVIIDRRDELGKLAGSFNKMATQVQNAKLELEKKVHLLKKSFEELRELASHLQDIREEERANMAREIHDELGQQLTGMKMDMIWALKKMPSSENNGVAERLGSSLELLDKTINTVRKLATDLRPSILDDLGLLAAIEWHSEEFEKRFGISTIFKSGMQRFNFSPKIAIGLFRICQESLTNVARYSSAKNVSIALQQESDQIALKICDDGIGFDPGKIKGKKTLGLLGMKERALMMGGEFEISSEKGKGTSVTVKVPTLSFESKEHD